MIKNATGAIGGDHPHPPQITMGDMVGDGVEGELKICSLHVSSRT